MRLDRALLHAELPPTITDGADVLFFHTHLVDQDTPIGLDYLGELNGALPWGSLTVIVLINPDAKDRQRMAVLRARVLAASSSHLHFEGENWRRQLTEAIDKFPAGEKCVVFGMPVRSAELAPQDHAWIDDLQRVGTLDALVIVTPETMDWPNWGSKVGFVRSRSNSVAEDTLPVGQIFLHLNAPGLVCCIDAEELASMWGSNACPTELLRGILLLHLQSVVFEEDPSENDCSRFSAIMSCLIDGDEDHLSIKNFGLLTNAIRPKMPDAIYFCAASSGLMLRSDFYRTARPFVILCKP